MGETIQETMAFKDADPKFYKGDYPAIYALVKAEELFDHPDESSDEYRTVKLSVSSGDNPQKIIPHLDVEVHGPEAAPEDISYLPVLGVKLKPDAKKWIRARAVHTHRTSVATTLVVRPEAKI